MSMSDDNFSGISFGTFDVTQHEEFENFHPLAQALSQEENGADKHLYARLQGKILTFIEAMGGDASTVKARKDQIKDIFRTENYEFKNHYISKNLDGWLKWFKAQTTDTASTKPESVQISIFGEVDSI